nr:PAS domain S-box protein [uncultured Desulfobacter sp.]
MKKNYIIFFCSLITLVCISAYQYSVFLDNFLRGKMDQMLKVAQISGINMASDFNAFENELSILNSEPFINRILSNKIDTETIRRLKQFFFRNQGLVKKLVFFNDKQIVSTWKTPENHFHFEPVDGTAEDENLNGSTFDASTAQLIVTADTDNPTGLYSALGIKAVLDLKMYTKELFKGFHLGKASWRFLTGSETFLIYADYSESVSGIDIDASKFKKADFQPVLAEINEGFQGTCENTIQFGGKQVKLITAYYPITLMSKQYGIIFSMDKITLLSSLGQIIVITVVISGCLISALIFLFTQINRRNQLINRQLEENQTKLLGDLNARKRVEKQLKQEIIISKSLGQSLRESEEKFRSIGVAAQDAIIMIDNDGLVSFWNDAATQILGYAADEMMSKNFHFIVVPEKYHDNYRKNFAIFQQTGKGRVVGKTLESLARKKSGEVIPVEVSLSAVKIDEKWNAIGILRDITKRKKTETELAEYRENLEALVRKRTKELEEAQKELLDKAMDAGRAQLSAMVLHNIGNAVTPLGVNLDRLRKSKIQQLSHYLRQCYNDLAVNRQDLTSYVNDHPRGIEVAAYMGRLIDDLEHERKKTAGILGNATTAIEYVSEVLSLQRSYAPGSREMKEKVRLNQLVRDALKIQKATISANNIRVVEKLAPELPLFSIEKNKLMQVVINFIKNSCDAIGENPEIVDHRITLSTGFEDRKIYLTIADTGCGVDADNLKGIFEFGISTKGSSGFGLYYCKSFVEANNGVLTLTSPGQNQGATVTMAFSFLK